MSSQYLRAYSLQIQGSDSGVEITDLHIKFSVSLSSGETPNSAEIEISNLNDDTRHKINTEYTNIILSAGYQDSAQVIFSGNVKRFKHLKRGGTDRILQIEAGDGDEAYNYSLTNTTIAKGATMQDQVKASTQNMSDHGVHEGAMTFVNDARLSRAKVIFAPSKLHLRRCAQASNSAWSIQNGKVNFQPKDQSSNVIFQLNSKSGLIGESTPTEDNGLECSCLLNPRLEIDSYIEINQSSVSGKQEEGDGTYKIIKLEHVGDSHGNEWTTHITATSKA